MIPPPSEPIRYAWVYHEALRRLGFRSDDIYVGIVDGVVGSAIMPVVHVRLVVDGRPFGIHVAVWNRGEEAFKREWQAFIDHLIGTVGVEQYGDQDFHGLWDATVKELARRPELDVSGLPGALVRNGFTLPVIQKRKS